MNHLTQPRAKELDSINEEIDDGLTAQGLKEPRILFRYLIRRPKFECNWSDLQVLSQKHDKANANKWVKNTVVRLREFFIEFRLEPRIWQPDLPSADEKTYRLVYFSGDTPDPLGFWGPHLWKNDLLDKQRRLNQIFITEAQFFRDELDTFYVRHFDVNTPEKHKLIAESALPELASRIESLTPATHYVSFLEVQAVLKIISSIQSFRKVGATFNWEVSTNVNSKWDSVVDQGNLILLGTSRGNTLISDYQKMLKPRYELKTHGLKVNGCLTPREIEFMHKDNPLDDKTYKSDNSGREYSVVVSRFLIPKNRFVLTSISSNHGPATLAVTEQLFKKPDIQALAESLTSLDRWQHFPNRFQAAYRVAFPSSPRSGPDIQSCISCNLDER